LNKKIPIGIKYNMERTKTIAWQDPLKATSQISKMPGLDYLQAIRNGKTAHPPLLHTLEFAIDSIQKGEAIFSFLPQEFHYNTLGTVHGGVISAILDSAMGCSLHSLLPAGTGYTTLELKVNFLKAVTTRTGKLRAIGRVIHAGSRTALVEAQLTSDDNTIYAHATSTCLILNHKTQ
jgi:uncharacterized protein (TIGR00369 family)